LSWQVALPSGAWPKTSKISAGVWKRRCRKGRTINGDPDLVLIGNQLLRVKEIKPRPFYNTRHSYISFLVSIGARSAFVSAQTGDSIKTIEEHYAKYLPEADAGRDLLEARIQESETLVKPPRTTGFSPTLPEKKKGLKKQPLRSGAGEEGRTPDLMLGKDRQRKRRR
jgi:hypothetical protein